MTELGFTELKREIEEISAHLISTPEDKKFIFWFFRAYITDDNYLAQTSVCGGSNDKGVDGVLLDDNMRIVYIVQSKYRKSISKVNEPRSDIERTINVLPSIMGDSRTYHDFKKNMEGSTAQLLQTARRRVLKNGYHLKLLYVTTGKKNRAIVEKEEKRFKLIAKKLNLTASFQYFCGADIVRLLQDYRDGVAPPIPEISLELEKGARVTTSDPYQRYDSNNKIESWIVSMPGDKVASLFLKSGVRIFARNIRGFLGSSSKGINSKIEHTLLHDPDKFFYYNNGVTIICDEAHAISEKGRSELVVVNPQIINGQQTTRVLAEHPASKTSKASVMVKIVQVPRSNSAQKSHFDELVANIVAGTNRQNAISQSDLVSNDRVQIELERNLRPLQYIYLRKKHTKSEARRIYGSFGNIYITKDDLAKASAASTMDQHTVRSGVSHLYGNSLYDEVFPTSEPMYYLPKFWLTKRVARLAKGNTERSYPKWMIIGFIWAHISTDLVSSKRKQALVTSLERGDPKLCKPLDKMIDQAFRASAEYYRNKRGKGNSKIELSQFYRNRKGRNAEFGRWWRGTKNKRRPAFSRAHKQFSARIREL